MSWAHGVRTVRAESTLAGRDQKRMDFAAQLGCPLPVMQVPRCQSQMTNLLPLFLFAAEKVVFGRPRGAPWRRFHLDGSRWELKTRMPKSKKRNPRRQCPRAMHARHDARLSNGVRPIRRPSVTIDHIVNRRSATGSDSSYLQKKSDIHVYCLLIGSRAKRR